MQLLDLFSGIGGFSLGLERAGFTTAAFCEIDPFCRRVLAKHWPQVPIYDDVRELTAVRLAADGIGSVAAICGGFPCQDISQAGRGVGLHGERSALWWEYHRLIAELRPRVAIIENVAALRSRGLDQVLGALSEIGYDAEWHCIPASSIGAPHRRDRIWIVAHPKPRQRRRSPFDAEMAELSPAAGDAHGERLAQRQGVGSYPCPQLSALERADWWASEPDVGRVAHGVSGRVDRLRALGNAVVPQIPEIIGRAVLEAAP